MFKGSEDEDDTPDSAELEFLQTRRCVKLAANLRQEVQAFVDGQDAAAFITNHHDLAAELASTPFGATLVKVIAYVYAAAAAKYLSGGLTSIVQQAKDSAHAANARFETFSAGTSVVSNRAIVPGRCRGSVDSEAAFSSSRCEPPGSNAKFY